MCYHPEFFVEIRRLDFALNVLCDIIQKVVLHDKIRLGKFDQLHLDQKTDRHKVHQRNEPQHELNHEILNIFLRPYCVFKTQVADILAFTIGPDAVCRGC
jgi:hypothetical protein